MKHRNLLKSLTAVLLLFALVAIAVAAPLDRPRLFQRKAQQPPTAAAPMPVQAQKLFDGSLRKKLLMAVVRNRTVAKLAAEGDGKKTYTRAEAEAAFDKLSKDHPDLVDGAIAEGSQPATAQLAGGKLTDFLQWLSDHSAEIMKIVSMIISILALFG